jgi:alpha-galactosidase
LKRRIARVIVALAMITLSGAPSRATGETPGASMAGVWLFAPSAKYPGLRMIELSRSGDHWSGAVTSDWYGPLALDRLEVADGKATFHLDNGNPRLTPKNWTLARSPDGAMHVIGDLWYRHIDADLTRGSAADAKARAFKLAPLPASGPPLSSNGLARTPPMGWSSWNRFAAKIDDQTVRAIADSMVSSGLRDAGYRFVNIDDGWQGSRAADGTIRPNARFPDMKALAAYVHARGLKLGIYSSPGPKTCAGFTGSYGHVAQDAKTFAAWGVDYLKYDLCSGEGIYRTAEEVKRAYREMGIALRATGRPIVYSLCQYGRDRVGSWGRNVGGNLWRTTGDIEDKYESMAAIGFDKNGDPANAGPGGWNDPDMLEIGNGGMSLDEYRTHLSLWAMLAAPLMLGNDVRAMTPDTRVLLENRQIIAIDQDHLGRQAHRVRKDGDAEIWTRLLADGSVALALFNRGAMSRTIVFAPADAGLTQVAAVQDIWAGSKDDPALRERNVPAHGVVLLRLSAATSH